PTCGHGSPPSLTVCCQGGSWPLSFLRLLSLCSAIHAPRTPGRSDFFQSLNDGSLAFARLVLPCPVRPDGSGSPWTFPRAMQRFVTEAAHRGGDEWNTHSCSRCYSLNHSYEATSCRTAPYAISISTRSTTSACS